MGKTVQRGCGTMAVYVVMNFRARHMMMSKDRLRMLGIFFQTWWAEEK